MESTYDTLIKRLEAEFKGLTLQDTKVVAGLSFELWTGLPNDLVEKLGASIQIQHSANGKGKLVIKYNSTDELDGILDHIK